MDIQAAKTALVDEATQEQHEKAAAEVHAEAVFNYGTTANAALDAQAAATEALAKAGDAAAAHAASREAIQAAKNAIDKALQAQRVMADKQASARNARVQMAAFDQAYLEASAHADSLAQTANSLAVRALELAERAQAADGVVLGAYTETHEAARIVNEYAEEAAEEAFGMAERLSSEAVARIDAKAIGDRIYGELVERAKAEAEAEMNKPQPASPINPAIIAQAILVALQPALEKVAAAQVAKQPRP